MARRRRRPSPAAALQDQLGRELGLVPEQLELAIAAAPPATSRIRFEPLPTCPGCRRRGYCLVGCPIGGAR